MGKGCRLHLSASIEPIWAPQPLTGWQWDEKPLRFHLDFPESPRRHAWGLLGKQSGVNMAVWWGSSKQLWHLPTWGGKNWKVNDVFTWASWCQRCLQETSLGPSSNTFKISYQIKWFQNEMACIRFIPLFFYCLSPWYKMGIWFIVVTMETVKHKMKLKMFYILKNYTRIIWRSQCCPLEAKNTRFALYRTCQI